MVEYLSTDKINSYNQNCVTGDKDHLYDRIKDLIKKARKIDIIVAFLMESGVRLIIDDLKQAVERDASLRILCGNYLNITQPQALYLLKDSLGEKVDLRFYNVPSKSFHPKAYIFEHDSNKEIFVGSSNISRSALTNGVEWNYRICASDSPEDYDHFKQVFEDLFNNKSIRVNDDELRKYSKKWKRPKLLEEIEKLEEETEEEIEPEESKAAHPRHNFEVDNTEEYRIIEYPRPIGAQIEALYELKKVRYEGLDKAVVVMATGVGKTFLAAFDSKTFKKVLFVAHREEILSQAKRTFKSVRLGDSIGLFSGKQKDKECDILLATVQTLGRKEYLNSQYFSRDEFDYIVIDEFHHAVAFSYKNIIEFFTPGFLLGLTATPERLDNRDVFALCDYNLVYEVRLKEAINKGWLVPFRYYGVYDETDYDSIDNKSGRYDEKQLEHALNINRRADLILHHYRKYNSKRALGFCSSRGHAVFMAEYFFKHGVKACAVISGNASFNDANSFDIRYNPYVMERKEAVKRLTNVQISIIFSVDIFNEGVDLPELDMVMFLRPTESPTVFLQQLGRGLRKKGGKKYLNILDFIGNYKSANLIPLFLTGNIKDYNQRTGSIHVPEELEYPDGCFVDFDFRIVDIFKKMDADRKSMFLKVEDEYFRIKQDIVLRPLRLSMYTYMDESIYASVRIKKELNVFSDYISFLGKINEQTDDEKLLIGTIAHEFLKAIEKTSMAKMYKMPVLLAFYNNGNMKLAIDDEDVYKSFKEFYSHGSNAVDMLKDKNTHNYREWGMKEYVHLARKNPIHFLQHSSPKFFSENGDKFSLNTELKKYLSIPAFVEHFKDIIDYTTRRFYKERLEKRLNEFNKRSEILE